MKEICSAENKIFKKIIQLSQKKYRDRYNQYILEGDNIVSEAIKYEKAKLVVISDEYKKTTGFNGVDIVFMKGNLFKRIAQTKTSQGILALAEKEQLTKDDFVKMTKDGNVVVLDKLQDPGNIGTIIRTADAAGYKGVVVLKGTGDVYSSKVVRAAAGSILRMPVIAVENEVECIELMKANGKKIIGTSLEAEKFFYEVDLSHNIALIVGNEGNGISREFLENADENIKIPMDGDIESLNAAVAAGILMYQSIKKG